MPNTSAAAPVATNARDGTTIRPVDVAAILADLLPDRWLVYALVDPALIFPVIELA